MILLTESEFTKLAALVKTHFGIHLGKEKKALMSGRLYNVLLQHHFDSFTDYYNYILADRTGAALNTLVEKLTTNHTYFMREVEHFHYFRDHVLPYWDKKELRRDLRVWSAGCSTGEEPYTLSMIISDYFGNRQAEWETKILATDISPRVLKAAEQGIYHQEQTKPLPAHWRKQYFRRLNADEDVLVDAIRSNVIFRSFNLMKPVFPFKRKFHAIFCRNVMIYFDAATKRELVNRFFEHTEPGGYLFIGHSESLNREDANYRYIMPSVYRKG